MQKQGVFFLKKKRPPKSTFSNFTVFIYGFVFNICGEYESISEPFLSGITYAPAQGCTQRSTQKGTGRICRVEQSGRSVNLTSNFHLMPRVRKNEVLSSLAISFDAVYFIKHRHNFATLKTYALCSRNFPFFTCCRDT